MINQKTIIKKDLTEWAWRFNGECSSGSSPAAMEYGGNGVKISSPPFNITEYDMDVAQWNITSALLDNPDKALQINTVRYFYKYGAQKTKAYLGISNTELKLLLRTGLYILSKYWNDCGKQRMTMDQYNES